MMDITSCVSLKIKSVNTEYKQDTAIQQVYMNVIQGVICAPSAHIAIAIARFNHLINDNLLNGAIDALKRIGQVKDENITVVWVSGAYELPLTASVLAKSKKYDAIIAIGTIIRGDTTHFEYIAGACSSGLSAVAVHTALPIAFGILTTESVEQAIERAGSKKNNKGTEAALTALEMINVLQAIKAKEKVEFL